MAMRTLFDDDVTVPIGLQVRPFKSQLLKWIGNKQRFSHEIASYFPSKFGTYFEPFIGSGAVLGTIAPKQAMASDVFKPLVEIWQCLSRSPDDLKSWYSARWNLIATIGKTEAYAKVLASYNANPNGADLLFLCRSCYGGVIRFRAADGYMSTPCGIHDPVNPESFASRVDLWAKRTQNTQFHCMDFETAMNSAQTGDMVYCDPPYSHSQAILYGAQKFSLERLFDSTVQCKARGVFVALSIDGTKRSGNKICDIPMPAGLFEHEVMVNCGRSMLKRFQMSGNTLEGEVVADRLLLTY